MSTSKTSAEFQAAFIDECGKVIRAALETPQESALLRERRKTAMRNIQTLGILRTIVEQEIRQNVAVARTAASSWYDYDAPTWAEIGAMLGVTKQAAAARYRDVAPSKE